MRTPKERPARRGYVAIGAISALAVWACMKALHVTAVIALLIVVAGIAVLGGAFSLRHRGINREIKRRK